MAEATEVRKGQYEGMFILDANLAGKHWDKARGQLQELLENFDIEIIRMEKWEERKLAYEIRKHKRGVYVLVYFKAPSDSITRLRKTIGLTEWVLREMILTHSGDVTDDMFRKPRVREKDREEGKRGGRRDRERPAPSGDSGKDAAREPGAEAAAPAAEAAAGPSQEAPKEDSPQPPAGEKEGTG